MNLRCTACYRVEGIAPLFHGCPSCGRQLEVVLDDDELREGWDRTCRGVGGVGSRALPMLAEDVHLGEGNTPLLEVPEGTPAGGRVFVKAESSNPTGSFKDRLNAASTSALQYLGIGGVAASSTGNQAVSVAAYAAAADLRAHVFIPYEAPPNVVTEVRDHGAICTVLPWGERGAAVQRLVEEGYGYSGRNWPRPLASPFGIEGYRTIAHEIFMQLDETVPTHVFLPSCGGDGLAGVSRGFADLVRLGVADQVPAMVAVQATASPSVLRAWSSGRAEPSPVPLQWSVALSLVDDQGGGHGLAQVRATGGWVISVSDTELLRAAADLARIGVAAEPAGAAGYAALARWALESGGGPKGSLSVAVCTGAAGRWPVAAYATEVGGEGVMARMNAMDPIR